MSDLREQYEAAWRQKRELDAHGTAPGEYIKTIPNWECKCGNTPEAQGFHLWNRAAWCYADNERDALASSPGMGPTYYYRCDRCFRTIVAPQGYVTDPPVRMRDVYDATFDPTPSLYWHEQSPYVVYWPHEHALNVAEREAINHDGDARARRAGAGAARHCFELYGLTYTEKRAARMAPWTSDEYNQGFTTELAAIRRETLEAVHGVCADCETPLENGLCLRCLEG